MVKATDGPVSRYINRKISSRITSLLLRAGAPVTPNQVSVIAAGLAFLSVYPYLIGLPWLAGLLVQASSVIDGVDGELARATGKASPKGALLDSLLDRVADIAVYVGCVLYAYLYGPPQFSILPPLPPPALATLGMLALGGDILVSYFHSKVPELIGKHPALIGRIPPYSSRDVRLFIIFVLSLAGLVVEALITVTTLSFSYVVIKAVEVLTSAGGPGT